MLTSAHGVAVQKGNGPYKVVALGEIYTKTEKRDAIRFARAIIRDTSNKAAGMRGDTVSVHMANGKLIYQCHWDAKKKKIIVEEL